MSPTVFISVGVPVRCIGVVRSTNGIFISINSFPLLSDGNVPGAMALTVIPLVASSAATPFVRLITPPFADA